MDWYIMDQNKFIQLCKYRAMHYINEHLDINNTPSKYEVFVVWSCYSKKTYEHRAIVGSTANDDYFEFTYNNHRFYMDVYKKTERQDLVFKSDYEALCVMDS